MLGDNMSIIVFILSLGIITTAFSQEACDTKQVDIVFVIHASSNAGIDSFNKQLQFIRNVTDRFIIGPNNVQVSVVTYGTDVLNEFFLNTYQNKSDVDTAIDNVKYVAGTNHVEKALQFVRLNSFKAENSGRIATKLVVVLLDGEVAALTETRKEATLLHHTGAKVVAVGVGSGWSFLNNLDTIANDRHYVFPLDNFEELESKQEKIENITCSTPAVCGDKPADIVFVLDSSSSVGATNFQKQLDFMAEFVKQFDIGPSDVVFGLVTFTAYAHNEFYFNSYIHDKAFMLSKIRSVRYRNGRSTATDQGLRETRRDQFVSYHGARDGANKVVIVIMEGESSDISKTITEANLLKTQGIQVIVVGVGRYIRTYEIYNMAYDQYHAFHIASYDNLTTLEPEIKAKACGAGETTHLQVTECGGVPADIVFVLDSSASTGAYNFSRQLQFVRDFVYQFQIGPQAIQISVVVLSSGAHEQFALNQYHDETSLMNAIVRITYNSGTTHTDRALSYVRQNSFLHSKGARDNATKIVVVVTSGHSMDPAKTATEAALLKKPGNVTVIAVGIGSGVNHTEMNTIASDPGYVLSVADFDALQTVTSTLTYAACQTCSFVSLADVVFIVDASSSEGPLGFQKQLDSVSRIVNDFHIGPDNVQISLVSFSESAHAQFYLNLWLTKIQVLAAIQRTRYIPGPTNTDKALEYARETLFVPKHGDRSSAKNYVILYTDGSPTNFNRTVQQAELLKQQNTEILAIGIGDDINEAELNEIASDSKYVIMVPSFDALKTIREKVKAAICEDQPAGSFYTS